MQRVVVCNGPRDPGRLSNICHESCARPKGSTLTLPQWGTVRLGSRRRGGKCNSGLIDTPQSMPVCLKLCVCVCVHTVDFPGSNYRIDFDASTPRRKHLLLVMRVNVVWSTQKKMNDPAEMPQIPAKVITNSWKRRGEWLSYPVMSAFALVHARTQDQSACQFGFRCGQPWTVSC